jgi:quinol monooxygenase YgiN
MTVRVIARIQAKPDKVAEVSRLLQSLVEPTRKEAGCITYELFQNLKDRGDFTFVEEWSSESALEAHAASAHIEAIGPKLAPVVVKAPDIQVYALVA